jgi:rubrerythrin
MDKKTIEMRVRQLLAVDHNACDIYADLAERAQTQKMKDTLLVLVAEEKKHLKMEAEILSIVTE